MWTYWYADIIEFICNGYREDLTLEGFVEIPYLQKKTSILLWYSNTLYTTTVSNPAFNEDLHNASATDVKLSSSHTWKLARGSYTRMNIEN